MARPNVVGLLFATVLCIALAHQRCPRAGGGHAASQTAAPIPVALMLPTARKDWGAAYRNATTTTSTRTATFVLGLSDAATKTSDTIQQPPPHATNCDFVRFLATEGPHFRRRHAELQRQRHHLEQVCSRPRRDGCWQAGPLRGHVSSIVAILAAGSSRCTAAVDAERQLLFSHASQRGVRRCPVLPAALQALGDWCRDVVILDSHLRRLPSDCVSEATFCDSRASRVSSALLGDLGHMSLPPLGDCDVEPFCTEADDEL